ncbi:LytR/AlgR family response regulator transcription factor [Chitinophagaceae bacterium MMS25-I14]
MENINLKALIVDDEHAACSNLQKALAGIKDIPVEVVGIAHNTKEAEACVLTLQPTVIFLDIEMPNENAFRFLERITPYSFEVIFVTAYDEYAVRAFRLNAIDYILKPLDTGELKKALEKLEERLAFKKFRTASLLPLKTLQEQVEQRKEQQQVIFRDNTHWEIVSFSNILYIEAMRSYAKAVFLKDGQERSLVVSHSVAEYEELLPGNIFLRVHKSFLVNYEHINGMWKEQEQGFISLKNKIQLPVSRRRYTDVIAFLKERKSI